MKINNALLVLSPIVLTACGDVFEPQLEDKHDAVLPPIIAAGESRSSLDNANTPPDAVGSFHASGASTYAYVTNSRANTVSVIDQSTLTVTNEIPVGERPVGLWPAPDGSAVYVANQIGGTLSRIDVTSLSVTATVPVGTRPTAVGGARNGSFVYVSREGPTSGIVVLNTQTLAASAFIPTDSIPADLVVTRDGAQLYAPAYFDGTVHEISTADNSVLRTLSVGANPLATTLTPDESRLWVPTFSDDEVAVVDLSSFAVVNTISGFSLPLDIAFSEDGSLAYVTGNQLGVHEVSVVDVAGGAIAGTIDVGGIPTTVTRSPNDGSIWVVNFFADNIAIIDVTSGTVSATIPVSTEPLFVAFVPRTPLERVQQAMDIVQSLRDAGNLSPTAGVQAPAAIDVDSEPD
jgi:YVTN family beta-propeller protein